MSHNQRHTSLLGRRFCRLLVIGRVSSSDDLHQRWLCRCLCGNRLAASTADLKNCRTRSCGCYDYELKNANLTGMLFDKLKVKNKTDRKSKDGYSYWRCRCKCGNYRDVSSRELLGGSVRSCGCAKADKRRSKRSKRKSKLDCLWTPEMDAMLVDMFKECALCGETTGLTTDHVLPLSRGFGLFVGNSIRLCQSCNAYKGSTLIYKLPKAMVDKIEAAALAFKEAWHNKTGVSNGN